VLPHSVKRVSVADYLLRSGAQIMRMASAPARENGISNMQTQKSGRAYYRNDVTLRPEILRRIELCHYRPADAVLRYPHFLLMADQGSRRQT